MDKIKGMFGGKCECDTKEGCCAKGEDCCKINEVASGEPVEPKPEAPIVETPTAPIIPAEPIVPVPEAPKTESPFSQAPDPADEALKVENPQQ